MAVRVRNLLDVIEGFGEQRTSEMLSSFRCAVNPDIERFVQQNALNFTKQGLSITYMVARDAGAGETPFVGFFAFTYKILRLSGGSLSRTSERRIAKFAEYDAATNTFTLPAPLIAQLGKNDLPEGSRLFSGNELIGCAESTLENIMHGIGGRAVYLECEDEPKLMRFYKSCGYARVARRFDKSGEAGDDALYHIYVKFLNPARVA